jgi:hypothetical protein
VLAIVHQQMTLTMGANQELRAEMVRMLTAHLIGRDAGGDEKTLW